MLSASQAAAYPPGSQGAAPAVAAPAAETRRTGSVLLLAGAGALVLLLIAGVGGYFVMHSMMGSSANTTASTNSPNTSAGGTDVEPGHEVGRYWVQVNTTDPGAVRAGEQVTMDSGQQFKIHFSPSENGYIYIIGPGEQNAPTTFLTAKPASDFGVNSNELKSGQDFTFPADTAKNENWMNLDKNAGTDEFTLIFSRKPLTTPAFLESEALRELSADERKELDDLLSQNKANLLGTEVIKTGASPFVSVKIPQTADGAPVIFKIKIAHP